jgi:hypothetical protein
VKAQHQPLASQAHLPILKDSGLAPSEGPPLTQAATPTTSTDISASHDIRLLPLQSIGRPPPEGWATTWHELPRAARDVQEQRGTQIYPVRRSGNDEIFPIVGSGLL